MLRGANVACALLAGIIAVALAFLVWQGILRDRDAAWPARGPDPSVFVGAHADYLLDFGRIGAIDRSTLPGILARMTPNEGRMPSVGHHYYAGGRLWLHFRVPSLESGHERWVLRLNHTRARDVRLIVDKGGLLREFDWQHDSPERRAGLAGRLPVFPFARGEIEEADVLLGYSSTGAMRGNVTVTTQRASEAEETWQSMKFGLLAGFLAALAIYLLVIGTRLGERSLIFAAGLSFFAGTFIYGVGGYFHTVLFTARPHLADVLLYATQPVMMTFWMMLVVSYLDLANRAPALAAVLKLIAMLLPFQGILTVLTGLGYPIPFIADNATPVMVGMAGGLLPLIWYSLRGDRRAMRFLACFTPVAVSSAVRTYLYLSPDAAPGWISLFESFVDIVATMTLLAVLIVLDIRRRETLLRKEARQNEQRFREFAEIASDSYFEAEPSGRVSNVAGRMVRDIGLSEGGNLVAALKARVVEGAMPAIDHLGGALAAGRELREMEIPVAGANGTRRWLSFNVVPAYGQADEGPRLRGTITDATERVERRHREARQNTLSALGQLASGVAHEVNNLLHPMVNLAQRVRDKHTSDAEARHLLDLVVASGRHAGEIVAAVLNSFNPVRPPGEPMALEVALDDALRTVQSTIPSTVRLERSVAVATAIAVPPGEVLQLVSNLLSNAIRAIDGRGVVRVSLERRDDGGVRLVFADDGPGMPEHIRARAAEPFVTGRVDGTGLGLSVVANIVRNWHGEMNIVSAPGKGTSIVILLPPGKGEP